MYNWIDELHYNLYLEITNLKVDVILTNLFCERVFLK